MTAITLVSDVRYLALFCIPEGARLATDCLFGPLKQHFRGHLFHSNEEHFVMSANAR